MGDDDTHPRRPLLKRLRLPRPVFHPRAFQATLFPLPGPAGGAPRFTVDLYHGGSTFTHPRFVCTAEEVQTLARLALAAESLVRDYLEKGKSFTDWCQANGVSPFKPDIGA